jgi:hypothetical protein
MKHFDIASYLREHQLGSYGILNHYKDLKPVKEDVAPEEDTDSLIASKIPYEGPNPKQDGFGDQFDQAEIVSENPKILNWEDLENTDIDAASMEIAIDDLIQEVQEMIEHTLEDNPNMAGKENQTKVTAKIRSLIKKLWFEKIKSWDEMQTKIDSRFPVWP